VADLSFEQEAESDGGDLVISVDQYHRRNEAFINKLKAVTENEQKSIKDILYNYTFHNDTFDDDLISLENLVEVCQEHKIVLNKTDISCIFTKFKVSDEIEAISYQLLEKEINDHLQRGETMNENYLKESNEKKKEEEELKKRDKEESHLEHFANDLLNSKKEEEINFEETQPRGQKHPEIQEDNYSYKFDEDDKQLPREIDENDSFLNDKDLDSKARTKDRPISSKLKFGQNNQ
jgi:hypothetical protein